jgi:hypothetical protein
MLRDLKIDEFTATCHGRGLWKKRFSIRPAAACNAYSETAPMITLARGAAGEPRQ